ARVLAFRGGNSQFAFIDFRFLRKENLASVLIRDSEVIKSIAWDCREFNHDFFREFIQYIAFGDAAANRRVMCRSKWCQKGRRCAKTYNDCTGGKRPFQADWCLNHFSILGPKNNSCVEPM